MVLHRLQILSSVSYTYFCMYSFIVMVYMLVCTSEEILAFLGKFSRQVENVPLL